MTEYEKVARETYEKVPIHELINFDKKPENPVKVSIIVPVCNVEIYLNECMDSIVNQTLQEIEIICVNDGSKDSSLSILKEYAMKDWRVKIVDKENAGYGHAMNIGIDMARGEYIGIVEPDDYVESRMFEQLYEICHHKDLDFVKSNFKRFYGKRENRLFENVPLTEKSWYYDRVINPSEEPIILKLTMNIWTGIYQTHFIKKNIIRFNETPGASFQDNGFWIQTIALAEKVMFINDYFYMNRRDNPKSSVKNTEKAFCVLDEFKYIDNFFYNHENVKKIFIYYYVYIKLVGYIGAYGRSSKNQKMAFLLEISKELNKHAERGEIDRDLYGPNRWKILNEIISDPAQYFLNDMKGYKNPSNEKLVEVYEKISIGQNKLSKIMETYNNILSYRKIDNDKIKISIIIPMYNVENYVKKCLDSITNQTLNEFEVICVDDGSTDNSFDVVLDYVKNDNRVILISQVNSGSGVARNKALEIAKGEYIAFMDADDWYPDEYVLEKLYSKAIENNALICGGSMKAYKDDGELQVTSPSYYSFEEEGFIYYKDYQLEYGYTRYIYKRDFLKNNGIVFPQYIRFQDPVFFTKAMISAGKFFAITETTYFYRKGHKKVKWTNEQCADLLNAFCEIVELSKDKYETLYLDVLDKVFNEYFSKYINYIIHNDLLVIEAFIKLLVLLDRKDEEKMISKITYYTSVNFVIPLRDERNKNNSLINKNNELEKAIVQLKKDNEKGIIEKKGYLFEIESIRSSWTYKIGRFITYIPRKIRSLCFSNWNV